MSELEDESAAYDRAAELEWETDRVRAEEQAEKDELKDKFLRSQAELENTRKRAKKELEDAHQYAEIALLRDLLPLYDNMERAINSIEENGDTIVILSGLKMMKQQLEEILQKHEAVMIGRIGEVFNPAIHEAIMQQKSEKDTGIVLNVVQIGLILHNRVVRAAQVIVSGG